MKSLTNLLRHVVQDCATVCSTSTTRDIFYITRRVEMEGDSFITITLPTFCSDFERSLHDGCIGQNSFRSFSKTASKFPKFLSGYLVQIFDEYGRLRKIPSFDAISSVRQICLLGKKIHAPCKKEREVAAELQYLAIEKALLMTDDMKVLPEDLHDLQRIASIVWGNTLCKVEKLLLSQDLTPRHGPGSTSSLVLGNSKYKWRLWTTRLESLFSASRYCYSSYEAWIEENSKMTFLFLKR
jgi:hypothetical protein